MKVFAGTRDDKGLWSGTTPKSLARDTYRYLFFVNGVCVADLSLGISLERSNIDSPVEVTGPGGDFQTFHGNIPHGNVAKVEYWPEPLGVIPYIVTN